MQLKNTIFKFKFTDSSILTPISSIILAFINIFKQFSMMFKMLHFILLFLIYEPSLTTSNQMSNLDSIEGTLLSKQYLNNGQLSKLILPITFKTFIHYTNDTTYQLILISDPILMNSSINYSYIDNTDKLNKSFDILNEEPLNLKSAKLYEIDLPVTNVSNKTNSNHQVIKSDAIPMEKCVKESIEITEDFLNEHERSKLKLNNFQNHWQKFTEHMQYFRYKTTCGLINIKCIIYDDRSDTERQIKKLTNKIGIKCYNMIKSSSNIAHQGDQGQTSSEEMDMETDGFIVNNVRLRRSIPYKRDSKALKITDVNKLTTTLSSDSKIDNSIIILMLKSGLYKNCADAVYYWKTLENCLQLFIVYNQKANCIKYIDCTNGKVIKRSDEGKLYCDDDTICLQQNRKLTKTKIDFPDTCSTKLYEYKDISSLDVNKNQDYCSFESEVYTYDNCKDKEELPERTLTIIDNYNQTIITSNHMISRFYNPKDIADYNCSKISCSKGNCLGDQTYMDNFGFGSADEYCSFNQNLFYYKINYEGELFPITCAMTVRFRVFREKPSTDNSFKSINPKCDKNGLLLDSVDVFDDLKVVLKKGNSIQIFQKVTSKLLIPLPYWYFTELFHEDISLEISNNGNSILKKLTCPIYNTCESISCYACSAKWTSVHCFGWLEYVLVTALLLVITSIFIGLMRVLLIGLSSLKGPGKCCKVLCCGCYLKSKTFVNDNGKRLRNFYTKVEDFNNVEEGTELITRKSSSKPKVHKKSHMRLPYYNNIVMILIFLFFLPLSLCDETCSDSLMIEAKSLNCDNEKCTISENILMKLNIGQTTCLYLRKDGKNVSVMKFLIEDHSYTCNNEQLYYHPDISIRCSAYHSCRGTTLCSEDDCEQGKNHDKIPDFKDFMKKVGKSSCTKVCGCAGCGCFLCSESCLYTREFLELKTNNIAVVFKCKSWFDTYNLSFKVTNSTMTKSYSQVLSPMATYHQGHFSFGVISQKSNMVKMPSCYHVIKDKVIIADCSEKGKPMKGSIGEIQCPNEVSAKELNLACLYDQSIITSTISSNSISCLSHKIDIMKSTIEMSTPMIYESGHLDYKGNTLVYTDPQNDFVELQVNIENYQVGLINRVTACEATFISLKGCYSCSLGSTLEIKARTLMKSTESLAILKCPSNKGDIAFNINGNDMKTYRLNMKTNSHNIDENCEIICSAGSTNIKISGDLDFIPLMNLIDNKDSYYGKDLSSSDFDIWSIFKTLWFKMIMTIILILILILVGKVIISQLLKKKKK